MIAYAEAPQAPLTIRKAVQTSKSLTPAEQKELLRAVQTLMQDAVPKDFDAWLEANPQERLKAASYKNFPHRPAPGTW